jgi:predicted acylesterase/phospholipase RssA
MGIEAARSLSPARRSDRRVARHTSKTKMSERNQRGRPAWYDKRIALILHGAGALGSYQAGVYEALRGSDYLPDWAAGISLGAVVAVVNVRTGNSPISGPRRRSHATSSTG